MRCRLNRVQVDGAALDCMCRARNLVWLVASLGLMSIAFGACLLVYPAAGTLALVWAIGVYAIAIGSLAVARVWLHGTSRFA